MTFPLSHKSCDGAHLQGPPYAGVMLRVCDTNAHLQGTPSAGVELAVSTSEPSLSLSLLGYLQSWVPTATNSPEWHTHRLRIVRNGTLE